MNDEHFYAKQELIEMLQNLAKQNGGCAAEHNHWAADRALLDYIDDDEVTAAFCSIDRWYA